MPPSPASASSTSAAAASDRSTNPATIATTTPTPSATGVSPSRVPNCATGSSEEVRCPANHRETSSSGPSIEPCSECVSSQPQPTTTSAMAAYAATSCIVLRAIGPPLLRDLPRAPSWPYPLAPPLSPRPDGEGLGSAGDAPLAGLPHRPGAPCGGRQPGRGPWRVRRRAHPRQPLVL